MSDRKGHVQNAYRTLQGCGCRPGLGEVREAPAQRRESSASAWSLMRPWPGEELEGEMQVPVGGYGMG